MLLEIKIIILILLSTGLIILTWNSLWHIQKHGIYRLISWVAGLALILLNIEYWFDEPFGNYQIVSWMLLIFSIAIVTYGTLSLLKGEPDNKRSDDSLLGIEKTTKLVTSGAYRYIRHPIYTSFLFGAWGVFLKHISWLSFILAVITSLFAIVAAKKEEIENIYYFGNAYRIYIKKTKIFIPYIF